MFKRQVLIHTCLSPARDDDNCKGSLNANDNELAMHWELCEQISMNDFKRNL